LASSDVPPSSFYSLIAYDPKIISVFEFLIRKDKTELVPVFEPGSGYYYPDIVKNVDVSPKESLDMVDKIVSLGLGTKVYYDQVLKCNNCGTGHVTVRFHCPFCNSTEIDKELLIEHSADGVMALLSSFKKKEGNLVCPGCGKVLEQEGKDYRNVGIWYGCQSCKKQFDTPKVKYVCRTCNKEIEIQDILISGVYRIVLKREVIEELSTRILIVQPVFQALTEYQLSPSMPGLLTGKSGIEHTFGIIGTKGNKNVAIDLAISKTKINEGPILAMSAKVMDTLPTKSIIICVPGLQDNAKKVAGIYGISVIEGQTVDSATEQLKKVLSSDWEIPEEPKKAAEEAPAAAEPQPQKEEEEHAKHAKKGK
jgi:predicted RNA-binding Zn-ribbon protein involved in translation (DUF1610 family)